MYPPFDPVSLIQQYYTTEPRLRPTGISLSPFLNHVILALVQKDSYLNAVIVLRFMFIAVFIIIYMRKHGLGPDCTGAHDN